MGSNPAEVPQGDRKGFRALAGEEDKGRALISSFDDKQKAIAIFDQKAPGDIVTMNAKKVDPLKTDGLYHRVDLKVANRKDLVVRARKGYYAPKL